MTGWRPPREIRAKVIGLAMRGDAFLAEDVLDDDGSLKGVRPLGGGIEFGETREQALHREFREETGSGIEILGPWTSIENIFVHQGAPGHELVFVAAIRLLDASLYQRASISFFDGMACVARWRTLDGLRQAGIALYPDGLDRLICPAI